MAPPDAYPIQQAMDERGTRRRAAEPADATRPTSGCGASATLPLMHQPGERWMYNTGSDVLGVLIARAAGQPLETFLRERIFEPLGMKDTGFSVPAAKLDRLATCYRTDSETGALEVYDGAADSQWSRPPAFPSGAGGLVSTVDDYLAFGQMMLNKGKHGRERILSRPSVEPMTTDQLTPEQKAASDFFPASGTTAAGGSACPSSPGATIWRRSPDGSAGTAATARPGTSDPKEELVGDPDDPARLGLPQRSGCLSRFLDLGLPGDRRLRPLRGNPTSAIGPCSGKPISAGTK